MINRITLLLLYSLLFSQQMGLPKSTPSDQIVHHSNYTLNYSEQHEQAEWVAYTLSSSDVYGSIGRTNDFRTDPKVKTGSASLPGFIKNRKYLAAYENPEEAQYFLRKTVFDMAKKHQKKNGLIWLAIGAAFLWLISSGEE